MSAENKWIQQIKSIYQDTSTEHDLQIKRVIEQIQAEATNEAIEQFSDTPITNFTEEREEAEA